MAEPQTGRIGGGVLKDNLNLKEDNGGKDFLNFKNTSSDTALLHIDAVNKRIGINDEAPVRDLYIPARVRSDGINTDVTEFPNITIENNEINITNGGDLFLNASENIKLSALATDQLLIDDDRISTTVSNANIDIIPSGTGTVEIEPNLRVYGDMYTPGNITLGGNLIFGDGPQTPDLVGFDKEINSSILLDSAGGHALGSESKKFKTVFTQTLNADTLNTENLFIGTDEISLRQGNILYVAVNGSDTASGDHQLDPFATIKRALQEAALTATPETPVTVYISPGDYEEEFPLEVPSNVAVLGNNLRSVIIRPDTSSQSEDAFLMNGESSVDNVTIRDYYYDSVNNKGYAFRFKPGMVTTLRSPYIKNVTVFTQGTSVSASDPRGFASGDAGRGAYIDGSDVAAESRNASMLFYAVTFMTPGVECIVMTNGVRVEWLNSFTYFADKGFHAIRGSTGRVGQDGSTVEYGAELRSIGSANVYGNYGAVADGDGTLLYLIQHNFAYIGVGKDTTNDRTFVIAENETVQLNSGKIVYTSTDQTGKYKVGDNFFVDLETGRTSIDANTVNFEDGSELVLEDGFNRTVISGSKIETGNIKITTDTIETLSGDLNLFSANPNTNISSNVNLKENLSVTGNIDVAGTLVRLGDEPTDKITLNTPIDQNFLPDVNSSYTLGTPARRWQNIFVDNTSIDDIRIFDNVITTTASNSNLELRSNSASTVNLKKVSFRQDTIGTTIDDDSSPADLVLNPNSTQNVIINADSFVLPNGSTSQRIRKQGDLRFNTDDNVFEGFDGTGFIGFGGVYSSDRRTSITADLNNNFINLNSTGNRVGEVNAKGLEIHGLSVDSISIQDNIITSNESNANLDIVRNGTGSVYFDGQEYFRNNTWTNDSIDSAFNIYTTDNGYVKINDTFGSVLNNNGTTLIEDTSLVSLGTGLTGATLINNITGGVTVVDPGTGTGTGGFDTYRHYEFTGSNDRSIETISFDLNNFTGGKFRGKVICGNASNGGEQPDGSENLILQWDDGSNSWEDVDIVVAASDFASFSSWIDFEINLPLNLFSGFDPSTIKFRFLQNTVSETTGDNYGLANIEFLYATDQSANPEAGAMRYNVGTSTLEVYDGINWIFSTGTEEDPVTREYMQSRTEIWTLILG